MAEFPPQHQDQHPGIQQEMRPKPHSVREHQTRRLAGKIALITGGDSGIGRATAIAYAQEGAEAIFIVYLNEDADANETKRLVEQHNCRCILLPGDIGDPDFCAMVADHVRNEFGRLDVLVNNAAEQHYAERLEDIPNEQIERTFSTNILSMFYLTKACLPLMREGGAIVNTTSVVAFQGHKYLLDYAATKGAILAFTRSLSAQLAERGIRVNAVAPGPIWTPLIPSSFPAEYVKDFGASTPMKRAGQPEEVAPSFVFLASDDASYMTGQVLHPNGGEVVA